jgi:hypothetical protein
MSYSLTLSDDTAYTNPALTAFDSSSLVLSIYSADNSDVDQMTLKLSATSDDNSAVVESTTFSVDILVDCLQAVITQTT